MNWGPGWSAERRVGKRRRREQGFPSRRSSIWRTGGDLRLMKAMLVPSRGPSDFDCQMGPIDLLSSENAFYVLLYSKPVLVLRKSLHKKRPVM